MHRWIITEVKASWGMFSTCNLSWEACVPGGEHFQALYSRLTHLIASSCFSVCIISCLLTHLERNHYPFCCQANQCHNFTHAKNTRIGGEKRERWGHKTYLLTNYNYIFSLTLSSVSCRGKEFLGLTWINKKYWVYNDIKPDSV